MDTSTEINTAAARGWGAEKSAAAARELIAQINSVGLTRMRLAA